MINLQVRHESGTVVAGSEHGVAWDKSLAEIDRSQFPMLAGVCPFADTVFNTWQLPMLLAELDRLPAARGGSWVDAVRALSRIAQEHSHRYVWFVGD